MTDPKSYLCAQAQIVNEELERILPPGKKCPERLHQAMRYSVFAGGKRLRPILCIAACEACGGTAKQALNAACALELLHTYTLIHDDLPAMDNDTLRRGRPACHIAFGEATAILAGDALLTLAFEVLTDDSLQQQSPSPPRNRLVLELARAAGSRGVIAGQAEDLAAEGRTPDADTVAYIHHNKTATLIRAACVLGGLCAEADFQYLKPLQTYGENLGLAFQLIDDLLDESVTQKQLGKNIGSDKTNRKMTWPAACGAEATREKAGALTRAARRAADALPDGELLDSLAQLMAVRHN